MTYVETSNLAGAALAIRHGNTVWSDDLIDRLVRMWIDEERTAVDIAAEFGVSRSAILGKIDRLGLQGRSCDAENRSKGAERREARKKLIAGRLRNPTKIIAKRTGRDPGLPVVPFEAAPEILAAAPCSLFELTDEKCHWPIGNPQEAGFHFCGGNTSAGPYCGYHGRVAYQPPRARQDKRGRI